MSALACGYIWVIMYLGMYKAALMRRKHRNMHSADSIYIYIQGEDRKKWPPMKIGFLDYNCVKRAKNVEKFINRTVQLPNMTEGLTLLNLKCNFHHTNR